MKSSEFKKVVTKNFAPFLRKNGWKGSGFDFRKEENDIINVLKIQPSRYGGEFCIEIGVYFSFLSPLLELEFKIDSKKITTWDLEIRKRLTPDGKKDFWWKFPNNEAEAESVFEEIKTLFLKNAIPYFDKYQHWKDFAYSVSIDKIENGDTKDFFTSIPLRTALFVARLKEYLGEKEDAVLFSKYGLSKIEGQRGAGLIKYFEKIINNCQ